jgi:hypothetical protein
MQNLKESYDVDNFILWVERVKILKENVILICLLQLIERVE